MIVFFLEVNSNYQVVILEQIISTITPTNINAFYIHGPALIYHDNRVPSGYHTFYCPNNCPIMYRAYMNYVPDLWCLKTSNDLQWSTNIDLEVYLWWFALFKVPCPASDQVKASDQWCHEVIRFHQATTNLSMGQDKAFWNTVLYIIHVLL